MVQRKEASGEVNLQRYTPDQYRAMGIEGAYYDAYGRINFAPPGNTTETHTVKGFEYLQLAAEQGRVGSVVSL